MNNIIDYASVFSELKQRVFNSQQKAIYSVNKELVLLYWDIGNIILKNQSEQGWGSKIIDSLSKDLKNTFPNIKGFSVRNLKYMRQFASVYTDMSIVKELLAQLSWYHNLTLIQKLKECENSNNYKGAVCMN
jgi:predicted nuclease of restriction endonuclease-like (RecB) superfamily